MTYISAGCLDAKKNVQPVRYLDTDDPVRPPLPGIGLCLSGGGYRAMLFHLGALWRLNELGLLKKAILVNNAPTTIGPQRLLRVSSVSGGSITAGLLGLRWKSLVFDSSNVATNFATLLTQPIRALAGVTLDAKAIVLGILSPWKNIADEIIAAHRRHLYGNATLQDLPSDAEGPRFVLNATSLQSKALWRFSKPFMGDYRVGLIRSPTLDLATAVTASGASPPFLSPVQLKPRPADFDPTTAPAKDSLQFEPYTSDVRLTDGGVYDNLGLETIWKNFQTVLVSDGGGATDDDPKPSKGWLRQVYRVLNLFDNQVGSLRKRQVIASYQMHLRQGTYWGMRTDIGDYQLPTSLPCPLEKTMALANTPTRLKKLGPVLQERIINWGYAVCDAAIRKHVDLNAQAPLGFPYPGGVG